MNDSDELITRGLQQRRASQAFRRELGQRSGRALARHYRRRYWMRRIGVTCTTMMLILGAYWVGQSTANSSAVSENGLSGDEGQRKDSVQVPRDLVTWLEAGRFFKQLGMEQRATRAFDQAGKLAPLGEFKRSYSETDHRRATYASLLIRSDQLVVKQQETQRNNLRRRRNLDAILAQSNGDHGHER